MYSSYITFLAIILAIFKENAANYKQIEELVEKANRQLIEGVRFQHFSYWNFTVNMTDSTEDTYIKSKLLEAKIWQPFYEKSLEFKSLESNHLKNESLDRQLRTLQRPTLAILSKNDYTTYLTVCTKMERLYGEAHICSYNNKKDCKLRMYPDLEQIFVQTRHSDILKHYWEQFYNIISKTKALYLDFIKMHKMALKVAKVETIDGWWFQKYDQPFVRSEINEIYKSIAPFYFQLHAFVRHRLHEVYGDKHVSMKEPIPMHLLGTVWAENWLNIQSILLPYPRKGVYDVTAEMKTQNYSVIKMYKVADDFMQSLGLRKLPGTLWTTCIGKPNPKLKIYCRPRSFDFYRDDDVCVRSCTPISHKGFQDVYQQMGHLQYFLQYSKKPFLLRNSPSPDLHEAIGDVMALSAMSPDHLKKIGILKNYTYDGEARINYLFRLALEKIVFIPFALSSDEYFWSLMRDEIKPENLNCAFWEQREEYTGVTPPVERSNKSFDAFANYYIAGDVELLRYVKAIILQFQLFKTACQIKSNGTKIIHLENCNFYSNRDVGNAFKTLLSSGAEKSWVDVVHKFGVRGRLSDAALKEFFNPLIIWLKNNNEKNKAPLGWSASRGCSIESSNEDTAGIAVQESVSFKVVFLTIFGTILFQNFY